MRARIEDLEKATGRRRPIPKKSERALAREAAEEAKRADAFLAALRRKLQPCTKGAIEIDQLDKWFRTNSKVLWPKGSPPPADFDMEAWLRAHGHRAGVAVQTRDAASGRAGLVQVAIEEPDDILEDRLDRLSRSLWSRYAPSRVRGKPKRPDKNMAIQLNDPMCDPSTLVYCLFRYRRNRPLGGAQG